MGTPRHAHGHTNAAERTLARRQEQPHDRKLRITRRLDALALPRYAWWKKEGRHDTTQITFDRRTGHVYVMFDLRDVTDNAVLVEIDPILKSRS